jgi:peptide subunit release factor 1 (eRF1)
LGGKIMLVSKSLSLGRLKMLALLDELASAEGEAVSLYMPEGTEQSSVEDLLKKVPVTEDVALAIGKVAGSSEMGAALFWGPQRKLLVCPPLPIREEYVVPGYDVEPLQSLLKYDFLIAIVLIRLGVYSIGICRGTELIDCKTGTSLVHARHKKGGSSQGRFTRHREKQIEYFLDRVCGQVKGHIQPQARLLDYLVYGGARMTILSLRKRCQFLQQFDDRLLRMLLDVPEPHKAVLEKAIGDIWSSSVTEWYESDL